jgi:hypothetical protein
MLFVHRGGVAAWRHPVAPLSATRNGWSDVLLLVGYCPFCPLSERRLRASGRESLPAHAILRCRSKLVESTFRIRFTARSAASLSNAALPLLTYKDAELRAGR